MSDSHIWGQGIARASTERLAASRYPQNSIYYETDTGRIFLTVLIAGVLAWVELSAAAVAAWGKYVVWAGAQPGPNVQYTTYTQAYTAATGDGCGPGKPASILIIPGATLIEDCTFRPGIHVEALGGGGSEVEPAQVRLVGQHVVEDVAGDLSLRGLRLESVAGTALRFGGKETTNVMLEDCTVTAGGAVPTIVASNTDTVNSSLRFTGCFVDRTGAALQTITSSVAVQATETTLAGTTNGIAAQLGVGTNDAFVRCDVSGSLAKEVGSCILRRTRVNSVNDPVCVGSASWSVTEVEAPSGMTFSTGATVLARKVAHQHLRNSFAGAGPHALTSLSDTVVVTLAVDAEVTATLPDVRTITEGDEWMITVSGQTLGAAVLVLSTSAGQFFSDGEMFERIYEGGSIVLRADRAAALWRIKSFNRGAPQSPTIYLDNNTGSDTNPGTAALPVASTPRALALQSQANWYGNSPGALIMVAAGHTEDLAPALITTLAVPASSSPRAAPLEMRGEWVDIGLPAKAVTGRIAANPAVPTWENLTFANDVAYANNGVARFWALVTGGVRNGARMLVSSSTNTSVELCGETSTSAGTTSFVIQTPNNAFSTSGVLRLIGGRLQLNGIDFSGVNGYSELPAIWLVNCPVSLNISSGGAFAGFLDPSLLTPPTGFYPQPTNVGLAGSSILTMFVGGDAAAPLTQGLGNLGGRVQLTCSIVTVLRSVAANLRLTNCASFNSTIHAYASVLLIQQMSNSSNGAVLAEHGSVLSINTAVFVGSSGNSVHLNEGSDGEFTALTGVAGGGVVGFRVSQFSRARVTDPNVGTTISGGAGVCVVGANASKAWALIAAGAAADVSDLGAAVPQICRCST